MINSGVSENVFESFKDTFEGEVIQISVDNRVFATKIEGGTLKYRNFQILNSPIIAHILEWEIAVSEDTVVNPSFRATLYPNGMIGWDTQWDCREDNSSPWHDYNNYTVAFKVYLPEYGYLVQDRKFYLTGPLFDNYEGIRYDYYSQDGLTFILKQNAKSFVDLGELSLSAHPNYQWEKYDQVKVDYIRKKIAESAPLTDLQESFLEKFPDYSDTIRTFEFKESIIAYGDALRCELFSIEDEDGNPHYFLKIKNRSGMIEWKTLNEENELDIWKRYVEGINANIEKLEGSIESREEEIHIFKRNIRQYRKEISDIFSNILESSMPLKKYYT